MKTRHTIATAVLTFVAWASSVAPAAAQEFVKVENAAREQLPAPQFVAAAYGFIWVAILTYVVMVARGLARTRTEIEDLKRRVDRIGGGGTGPG
jgi:CcmD family protein